jgi:hypothetical protein
MSIAPPSDIIMDVIRAAGHAPTASAATTTATVTATATGGPIPIGRVPKALREAMARDWDAYLKAAGKPERPARLATARSRPRASEPLRKSMAKLEGVLLQTMLQGIMAGRDNGPFGAGLAGGYWKSLMVQAIAEKIAERGGIGIADSALGIRERFEQRFLSHLSPSPPQQKEEKA